MTGHTDTGGVLLATRDLTKKYGGLTAVDDVTWEMTEGTTKAIIGPNGAGKSTFFNLLCGLISPTDGDIQFRGESIVGLRPNAISKRGMVKTYQVTNIFEEATVFENIRVAAQVDTSVFHMIGRADQLESVNEQTWEVLDRVGMSTLAEETASTLSYGDQRKLELGISLAVDPELLLLDEPTAGMSPEETGNTINLLREIAEDTGVTILITEHDIDLIMNLAREISVFHKGQLLTEGTPSEIRTDDYVQEVYLGQ